MRYLLKRKLFAFGDGFHILNENDEKDFFRRIATRYDKLADTFFGFVCLAATLARIHSFTGGNEARPLYTHGCHYDSR